jgi:hypothetical protein
VSGLIFEGGTVPAPPASAGGGGLARPPRRRMRTTIAVLVTVLGLGCIAGGGVALYLEMTRSATPAEVAAAGQAEVASRWTRLTAGKIFPATVGYLTSNGVQTTAYRAGIAPGSSCTAALDPAMAAVAHRHGCRMVLRATYLDASGTLAVTVGVAVMQSPLAAQQANATALSGLPNAGVRAATFPGTTAGQFGDAQRGWFQTITKGPYVFLYAAGYADGRPGAKTDFAGPADLGMGVLEHVAGALSAGGPPCQRTDVQC